MSAQWFNKHGSSFLSIAVSFLLVLATPGILNAQSSITIGIVGDQTGAKDLDDAYAILERGVAALQGKQLDVVLHVGDLVESTQSEAEIRSRFAQGIALLNELPSPWYLTAGDHDVNPTVYKQDSSDRSREDLFKQLYSAINPAAADNLHYSFDVKNYHIVVLYSIEHLHTDPRWGNVFFSRIYDNQYDWLVNDLASNTAGKAGTIVLLHQPMWYNWTGWSRVHELLVKHKVNSVVAGHFHYNQTQISLGGIDYRVMGATGGTTKQGSSNSGDSHHVAVMQLTEDAAPTFEMIPPAPFSQTTWTEKPVMDRIQALDLDLGNIFSFASNSPVFIQSGVLVSACDSTDPATLVVKDIGNAAAIPVNVTINVTGVQTKVTSAAFGDGLCQSDIDEFECLLEPSAGVAVSNNSLVQVAQYPPSAPLWTAELAADGNSPPSVGTPITVTVAESFIAENQTYFVYQTGTTNVQACD